MLHANRPRGNRQKESGLKVETNKSTFGLVLWQLKCEHIDQERLASSSRDFDAFSGFSSHSASRGRFRILVEDSPPQATKAKPARSPEQRHWLRGLSIEQASSLVKLRYTREEAAFSLATSVRTIDYRIKAGQLSVVYEGSIPLVHINELNRYSLHDHSQPISPKSRKNGENKN